MLIPLARVPLRTHKLRTSARNMLRGIVTSIVHGPVNAEVGLLVGRHLVLDAIITNSSVDALDLHPGGEAIALIKSSFVTLVEDVPGLRLSARNQIGGRIVEMIDGPVETEVVVAIEGGQRIAAVITSHSAREMMLEHGAPILCCFKASHVIVAVED